MSHLADLFALQLRAAGIEGYVREIKFHPARRWRFDFAWEAERIAVEVDGGQWLSGTGHNSGVGRERDCEKDAEALLLVVQSAAAALLAAAGSHRQVVDAATSAADRKWQKL